MQIEVHDYNPVWAEWFVEMKSWLEGILAGTEVVGIEHVGSTSVAGLASKPILDIDVVVKDYQLADTLTAFEKAGHVIRGNLGIPDRYAVRLSDPPHRSNTYIILDNSLALKNHLTLRSVLRTNEEMRNRYLLCKQELALSSGGDIDVYCKGKTDIISEVLRLGGLTEDEVESIASSNR